MSTDQPIGRAAVMTGGSSGIGEATARALAADGHHIRCERAARSKTCQRRWASGC
jgi:NAD(P)-dependent dehydrogenase (short-subunit alcohol dehydrogenase family)